MTTKEKIELVEILDRHSIQSIFYSERCTEGGVYHLILKEHGSDKLEEDWIVGEIKDYINK